MGKLGHIQGNIDKVLILLLGIILAILPFSSLSDFYIHMANLIFINTILAISWNILARIGLISFGHGGFLAIGAYISTILITKQGAPYWCGFLAGGIGAGIVALLTGVIVLRLRGVYFVLATGAFNELVRLIVFQWKDITGKRYSRNSSI